MSNKTSDKNVANEEKDSQFDLLKRIQELEEKVETKQKFIIMASEVIKNSIPKQAVIDKIDELKLSGGSNGKDNVENLVRELAIDILQELLEGGRK